MRDGGCARGGSEGCAAFAVSVVIPVYNAGRYVRQAVESAIGLTDVGEVIVVDDASPDNAVEVCQQLQSEHPKVRLLRHPDGRNHGAGASRNLGIQQARHEFIAFLDADDYYLPDRFSKDREILSSDPTVDGVYGGCGIEYESEEARKRFQEAGYAYQEFTTVTAAVPPEELIEVLSHCHPAVTGEFATGAITVRRGLLDRTGLFDTHLRLRQDIHLWYRMAAVGRLVPGIIDRPVFIRRVHAANRMVDQAEHRKYDDYWWESLKQWFAGHRAVPTRARRGFERAYCQYRIAHRSRGEARRAFLSYVFKHPALLRETYGFFDLNLLEAFGRNWWTLHGISLKNRSLRRWPTGTAGNE